MHDKLTGEDFGQSVGEALRCCLEPSDDYSPTQQVIFKFSTDTVTFFELEEQYVQD